MPELETAPPIPQATKDNAGATLAKLPPTVSMKPAESLTDAGRIDYRNRVLAWMRDQKRTK